jgi:hypothetical protein
VGYMSWEDPVMKSTGGGMHTGAVSTKDTFSPS